MVSATVCSAQRSLCLKRHLVEPDRDQLGQQEPLRRVPSLLRDEQQLPSGDGLPPPSEPTLPGMEPDLPATKIDKDDA